MAGPGGKRRSFTLVELLVVIAIIGILVGLLLPAIQAAREAGRRIECINNVKQLGLAMHKHLERSKGLFPSNWGGPWARANTKGRSWLTALLPDLEETPLYERILPGEPARKNLVAVRRPVRVFRCPSDTHEGTLSNQMFLSGTADPTVGVTNYKAVAGSNWGQANGAPEDPHPCAEIASSVFSYRKVEAGFGGRNADTCNGLDYGDGLICRGQGPDADHGAPIITSDFQIRDGMSNTLAIGESVPQWCAWSAWYWHDGCTATCGIPMNFKIPPDAAQGSRTYRSGHDHEDRANNYGFMSRHPGGAVFGVADGSARFISEDINPQTYRGLATTDGKELLGEF